MTPLNLLNQLILNPSQPNTCFSQVSTHELGAFTTYTKRVYYDTYDATDAMRIAGGAEHVVGVSVGDGWYSQQSVKVGQQTLLLRARPEQNPRPALCGAHS